MLVEATQSIHVNQGQDVTNLMRVECVGSTLRLSVNGHLLAEATDNKLTEGDIGLGSILWGGTFAEVAFDNIVVTAP